MMILLKFIILLIIIIYSFKLYNKSREGFDNDVPWDKAYFINVKTEETRKKYMIKQFDEQNINVKRFEAIDKTKIDDNYINELVYQNKILKNNNIIQTETIGSLACLLSHCALWDMIYNEDKKEMYLIFEDDCKLDEHFKKECKEYIKHLPPDWDMAWLGYNRFLSPNNNNVFNKPLIKTPHPIGVNAQHHCYLIKKSSIPKIKNVLLPITRDFHTKDSILRNNFDKYNAYFLFKKMAVQDTETFVFSTRDPGTTNG